MKRNRGGFDDYLHTVVMASGGEGVASDEQNRTPAMKRFFGWW